MGVSLGYCSRTTKKRWVKKMKDRFKFRVWDKYIKGYVEDLAEKCVWIEDDGQLGAGVDDDSCILEQCTGLKDKSGNLIYEGDIVEITIFGSIGPNGGYVDSDEIYKGTVVWDRDCFLVKTDTDTLLFPHSEDCTEIIGNIHE